MGDAENAPPPSKKRVAGRQISRENPDLDDEDNTSVLETGTFKRASDEVMASRRIVKARRHQAASAQSAPSSNPFAGISFVPPPKPSAPPVEVSDEAESGVSVPKEIEEKNGLDEGSEKEKNVNDEQLQSKDDDHEAGSIANKDNSDAPTAEPESANVKTAEEEKADYAGKRNVEGNDNESGENNNKADVKAEKSAETESFSSFQQLSSSQNAFTGLAGTGFSSSAFSFGSVPNDGSQLGSDSGSSFAPTNGLPSFGLGLSDNGNSSLFGTPGTSIVTKSEGSRFPSMQEVPFETGEENEKAVFTADSVMFEYLDGGWKERGKGEVKVNVSTTGAGKARLVMRARGNYRLILNANLYPDMKLTNMDKRGITFACVNSISEGKDGFSTFALKFKDASIVEEFRTAVAEHKGTTAVDLKTPENSP